jgi:hypothetical protein
MGRIFWDGWFTLPQEYDSAFNPAKVEFFGKLRRRRSNGWVVLELRLKNHSRITVRKRRDYFLQ